MESKSVINMLKFLSTPPLSLLESHQQFSIQTQHTSKEIPIQNPLITSQDNPQELTSKLNELTISSSPNIPKDEIKDEKAPQLYFQKNFGYDVNHKYVNHRFSVAPMLDITDSHYRTLARMLTSHAILYTEMVHCDTILNSKHLDFYLDFHPVQHPIVLQLGGSNPQNLAEAAKLAVERYGYDEVNLNCGCPSPRVTCGSFGACLMKDPETVVRCINAIKQVVKVPISIKCRLGVDKHDSYEFVHGFIEKVANETNIDHFVIHARKAFLKGLNPKENRTVPPLQYDSVYRLAKDFPHIHFSINGGIKTIETTKEMLERGDLIGCMIGRAAYENMWILSCVDREIFGVRGTGLSRREILILYGEYADNALALNPSLNYMTLIKPLLSLFSGERGSTLYKRLLSEKEHFEKEGSVSGVMNLLIKEFEKSNPDSLNKRSE
jgi:tRNA-dihydrouridine synthase A